MSGIMTFARNSWQKRSGKLIRSYLTDRSIKAVLSDQSSSTVLPPSMHRFPQGSILGPLLFSVFIEDLGDECENQLYLYADDSTLFCEITSRDNPEVVTASSTETWRNEDLGSH